MASLSYELNLVTALLPSTKSEIKTMTDALRVMALLNYGLQSGNGLTAQPKRDIESP